MRDIIVVNFERTLQMLKRAIDDCPDNVWDVPDETVSIWQYAYPTSTPHCERSSMGWSRIMPWLSSGAIHDRRTEPSRSECSRRARLSAQKLGRGVAVQRARWAPTFVRPAQES